MKAKPTKSKIFDAAQYLETEEDIAEYMSEALLTGDAETIVHAIEVAKKARGRMGRHRQH